MSDRIGRLAVCLLLGLSLLCGPRAGLAAEPRLPLWEARGGGRTVYLFGSIHVCTAACFPLGRSVLERFERSDALVVELDPGSADVGQTLLAEGVLPAGETLDTKLGRSRLERLRRAAEMLGLSPEMLGSFRPWLLSATLSLQAAQQAGFNPANGVDLWLMSRARDRRKPLIELETMARQIQALSAGSDAEQIDALDRVIDLILNGKIGQTLAGMISAWKVGDAEALHRFIMEDMPDDSVLTRELLERRNHEMAERILQAAAQGQRLFVTVGAAHMVGREGLPELLRRAGMTVRQLRAGE